MVLWHMLTHSSLSFSNPPPPPPPPIHTHFLEIMVVTSCVNWLYVVYSMKQYIKYMHENNGGTALANPIIDVHTVLGLSGHFNVTVKKHGGRCFGLGLLDYVAHIGVGPGRQPTQVQASSSNNFKSAIQCVFSICEIYTAYICAKFENHRIAAQVYGGVDGVSAV